MRRIGYLSGTRADFGLMRACLQAVHEHPACELGLYVTGMHLCEPWMTVSEVRASAWPIAAEVPVRLQSRDGRSMALALADTLSGMTHALGRERPDVMLLLGDRGEMLAGALAALHLGIPTVHLHGGERSGTVDEPVRHAISKLATWHFVATASSRERLIRMGEAAARIHVVGAPGLVGLQALSSMSRDQCIERLGLDAHALAQSGGDFLLCVFHPVVQQAGDAHAQTLALLDALHSPLPGRGAPCPVVWIEPNADAGSGEILAALEARGLPAGSVRLAHAPRELFLATMRHARALVGNSSAGIIEAGSLGTPVLNIGDRQRLRERGPHVRDLAPQTEAIRHALRAVCDEPRPAADNRWGDGQTAQRVAALLAELPLGPVWLEKVNRY